MYRAAGTGRCGRYESALFVIQGLYGAVDEIRQEVPDLRHRNAVIYKDVFRHVKDNSLWLGVNNGGTKWFEVPEGYDMATCSRIKLENGKKYFSLGNTVWFTNLETAERRKDISLYEKFNPAKYPKYDNYDAIEVSRVAEIPADYEGIMGVPVTFLDRYNPEQFEILGSNRGVGQDADGIYGRASYCNGKETFKRLFIRNKRVLEFHT